MNVISLTENFIYVWLLQRMKSHINRKYLQKVYMTRWYAVSPDHEQLQQEIVVQFLKEAL